MALAVLAVLFTLPSIAGSGFVSSSQTMPLIGICFAATASIAVTGWLGGAAAYLFAFQTVVVVFFLIGSNCKTNAHLQLLVLAMALSSLFIISQGLLALQQPQNGPYLLLGNTVMPGGIEGTSTMQAVPRTRGLGVVNDPNDLAQLLVSLIPCLFIFWRVGRPLWNFFAVGVPLSVLLTGMYDTHSRGGAIALMAIVIVAARRKVGTIPAAVFGVLLLTGALAIGWGGGRDVSVEGGEDRLELWSAGIQVIKSHPLFGVGVGNFGDYAEGHTAHNSVVVCAAEVGLLGLFFWVAFLFTTLRGGVLLGRVPKSTKDEDETAFSHTKFDPVAALHAEPNLEPVSASGQKAMPGFSLRSAKPVPKPRLVQRIAHPLFDTQREQTSDDEIRRIARLLVTAMVGFLAAGWFLSRALSIWLFMYAGMLFSVLRMGRERGLLPPQDSIAYVMKWSLGISIGLIVFIDLLLRATGH
jgi:O-antigen ligase